MKLTEEERKSIYSAKDVICKKIEEGFGQSTIQMSRPIDVYVDALKALDRIIDSDYWSL